jgi:hypothetical protein
MNCVTPATVVQRGSSIGYFMGASCLRSSAAIVHILGFGQSHFGLWTERETLEIAASAHSRVYFFFRMRATLSAVIMLTR